MSQTSAPRPQQPPCLAIHTESALVGMRMFAIATQGKAPADDVLQNILRAYEQNKQVAGRSFPIEQLDMFAYAEMQRREAMAKDFLTVMLHHVHDVTLMTRENMEVLAAKAWELTGAFGGEARAAQIIDQLTATPKT